MDLSFFFGAICLKIRECRKYIISNGFFLSEHLQRLQKHMKVVLGVISYQPVTAAELTGAQWLQSFRAEGKCCTLGSALAAGPRDPDMSLVSP